jgi:hypothetical protein
VREIPQLRADSRVLALLEASVAENVATVLHGIDLEKVHAPAAAEAFAFGDLEYRSWREGSRFGSTFQLDH